VGGIGGAGRDRAGRCALALGHRPTLLPHGMPSVSHDRTRCGAPVPGPGRTLPGSRAERGRILRNSLRMPAGDTWHLFRPSSGARRRVSYPWRHLATHSAPTAVHTSLRVVLPIVRPFLNLPGPAGSLTSESLVTMTHPCAPPEAHTSASVARSIPTAATYVAP